MKNKFEEWRFKMGEVRESIGTYLVGSEELKTKFKDGLLALLSNRKIAAQQLLLDYEALNEADKADSLLGAMNVHRDILFLDNSSEEIANPKTPEVKA